MSLERMFNLMAEKQASDLFFSVGSPITIKINGVCVPINQDRLAPQAIVSLLAERLTGVPRVGLEAEHVSWAEQQRQAELLTSAALVATT